MIAMVLAAGTGTRLMPLTTHVPKALLQVDGVPLLGIVIQRLIRAGADRIIINVHHHAPAIYDYLRENNHFGVDIAISDESTRLLDTGGAIKQAVPLFGEEEHILIHNVDILSNLDLDKLYHDHADSGAAVTLVTKDRPTSRFILVDGNNRFCGWENPADGIRIVRNQSTPEVSQIAFSGVYLLNKKVFETFPEEEKFGLFDWLLGMTGSQYISTWNQQNSFWYEVGRLETLANARKWIAFQKDHPDLLVEKRS